MSGRILRWISHRNVQLVGAHAGWDGSPTRPHVFFDVFTMFVQLLSAMCCSIRVSDAGRAWGRSQRAALSTSIHTLEGWCSSLLPSVRQRSFISSFRGHRADWKFGRRSKSYVVLFQVYACANIRFERSLEGTFPLCCSADAEVTRFGPEYN